MLRKDKIVEAAIFSQPAKQAQPLSQRRGPQHSRTKERFFQRLKKNDVQSVDKPARRLPLPHQSKWISTMNNKEEYTANPRRDWITFVISLVVTLVILVVAPEWVWVGFPFVLTSLAGAMGRL